MKSFFDNIFSLPSNLMLTHEMKRQTPQSNECGLVKNFDVFVETLSGFLILVYFGSTITFTPA